MRTTQQQLVKGVGPLPRTKQVVLAGIGLRCYSIGWLAYTSNAAQVTLRLWERNGVLPRPLVRIGDNRWYTSMEVLRFAAAIRCYHESSPRDLAKLRAELIQVSQALHQQLKLLNDKTKSRFAGEWFTLPDEAAIIRTYKQGRKQRKLKDTLPDES